MIKILEYFSNLHIPSWAWNHSVDEPISNGGQVYGTDENFPNLIIFPVDGVSEKQNDDYFPNHDGSVEVSITQCGNCNNLLSKYFCKYSLKLVYYLVVLNTMQRCN